MGASLHKHKLNIFRPVTILICVALQRVKSTQLNLKLSFTQQVTDHYFAYVNIDVPDVFLDKM